MADVRWKDKPQLVALAGTELLAATSVDGGAKVGGGTIAANADLPISTGQILAAAADAADAAITAAIGALSPGGVSLGVQFLADTSSTADADPGAGNLRWNHATQASATVLFLDDASVDGASLTGFWSALDAGGFAYLQHATDQDIWQIWEITAVTDDSGYVKLTVTLLVNGGSFADDEHILVTLEQGQVPASGAPVVVTTISSGTITPTGTTDLVRPATLTSALTIANPSSTPADGFGFEIDLFSVAAQGLTWGSKYANRMGTLPATTVAGSKHQYVGVVYNAADDKLYCRYAQVQA